MATEDTVKPDMTKDVNKTIDQGSTQQVMTYIYDSHGKMVTSFVSHIDLLT